MPTRNDKIIFTGLVYTHSHISVLPITFASAAGKEVVLIRNFNSS